MSARPKIVLALGGGVARGWAHIGAIRTLLEAGYVPDAVCGTSIGALVGGLYLAGKLDALETWARELTQRRMVGLLDFTFGGSGLFGGERLAALLEQQIGGVCIEALDRPYVAIATELDTGREVWLRDGSLAQAMRASYAMPGVFSPVQKDGQWLIDGALVNPCPTSAARAYGGQVVIAISLHTDLIGSPEDAPPPAGTAGVPPGVFRWRPDRFVLDRIFGKRPSGPALSAVMTGALNILLDRVTRARLAGDPPDVLVAPQVAHVGLIEFHRAAETIELGARAVREALPQIKYALSRLGG